MNILGISAFYHDSAAAVVRDGQIVAAAQEERFTRVKHDSRFPSRAVEYCLAAANLAPEKLDYVVFYEKPLLKFERLLETYLAYAPRGFGQFLAGLPVWLKQKLHLPREMDKALNHAYQGRYIFTEHHESHAASAFFPSPFEEAAILTMDGVGEWATASFGVGRGNRVELSHELHFPHSLGLLYSAFTYFTGFKVNSGEYKLMGLAPYGEPKYRDLILEKLIDLKPDGSFRMNMDYFGYCHYDVHDEPPVRESLRRPGPQAGKPSDPAGNGYRRLDPGRHRRSHAADHPAHSRRDRHEEPRPGRRRGPQLRRQWTNPAGDSLREPLDSAGGRRCGRRPGCGPVRLVPTPGQQTADERPRHAAGLPARPRVRRRPHPPIPRPGAAPSTTRAATSSRCSRKWPT